MWLSTCLVCSLPPLMSIVLSGCSIYLQSILSRPALQSHHNVKINCLNVFNSSALLLLQGVVNLFITPRQKIIKKFYSSNILSAKAAPTNFKHKRSLHGWRMLSITASAYNNSNSRWICWGRKGKSLQYLSWKYASKKFWKQENVRPMISSPSTLLKSHRGILPGPCFVCLADNWCDCRFVCKIIASNCLKIKSMNLDPPPEQWALSRHNSLLIIHSCE